MVKKVKNVILFKNAVELFYNMCDSLYETMNMVYGHLIVISRFFTFINTAFKIRMIIEIIIIRGYCFLFCVILLVLLFHLSSDADYSEDLDRTTALKTFVFAIAVRG